MLIFLLVHCTIISIRCRSISIDMSGYFCCCCSCCFCWKTEYFWGVGTKRGVNSRCVSMRAKKNSTRVCACNCPIVACFNLCGRLQLHSTVHTGDRPTDRPTATATAALLNFPRANSENKFPNKQKTTTTTFTLELVCYMTS